jgi:hypothetical protein
VTKTGDTIALVENLQKECIHATALAGYALRFEEAVEKKIDLSCDVARKQKRNAKKILAQ